MAQVNVTTLIIRGSGVIRCRLCGQSTYIWSDDSDAPGGEGESQVLIYDLQYTLLVLSGVGGTLHRCGRTYELYCPNCKLVHTARGVGRVPRPKCQSCGTLVNQRSMM